IKGLLSCIIRASAPAFLRHADGRSTAMMPVRYVQPFHLFKRLMNRPDVLFSADPPDPVADAVGGGKIIQAGLPSAALRNGRNRLCRAIGEKYRTGLRLTGPHMSGPVLF